MDGGGALSARETPGELHFRHFRVLAVGIALGVATLIIVMSVMNGFRAELLGRILGLNGHLIVQSITGSIPDYDALAARLRMIPGVTSAAPLIEGQVLVNAEGASFGALVRGLETEDLKRLTTVSSTLSAGALEDSTTATPSSWARGWPRLSVLYPA